MLKWTVHKRADPTSNVALVLGQSDRQQLNSRRSLGNLSRPLRHRDNRSELRRKSLGSSEISKRIHNRDKENQHVQTPHPYSYRGNVTSSTPQSFGKLDFALRDVRNLTPKNASASRKRPLPRTPPSSPTTTTIAFTTTAINARPTTMASTPAPYATTLPTFDVEYSPCGAGAAVVATTTTSRTMAPSTLSSITVTDSYFNQPRYFQEPLPASKRLKFSPSGTTPLTARLSELRFSKISFKGGRSKETQSIKPNTKASNNNNISNKNNNRVPSTDARRTAAPPPPPSSSSSNGGPVEESFSSSALDDSALDKMIDAILESARKERPSIVRNLAVRKVHLGIGMNGGGVGGGGNHAMHTESPTYTAAEDPASDLNKYCDNFLISPDKLLAAGERTIILEETNQVNEREVKTPDELSSRTKRAKCDRKSSHATTKATSSCHLRRQRAVRRKHNQNQKCDHITSSIIVGSRNIDESISEHTPKTPSHHDFADDTFFKKSSDELANMNTPIVDAAIASSTPTNGGASIRRCLNFSDFTANADDSMEKRKSTASSTVSMASTSTSSSYTRMTTISGSIDAILFIEQNKLNIHGESAVWSWPFTYHFDIHSTNRRRLFSSSLAIEMNTKQEIH